MFCLQTQTGRLPLPSGGDIREVKSLNQIVIVDVPDE
jgi:hypothetical protein